MAIHKIKHPLFFSTSLHFWNEIACHCFKTDCWSEKIPPLFSTSNPGLAQPIECFRCSIWSLRCFLWSSASSNFALFLTISLSHHFSFALFLDMLLSSQLLNKSFSSSLSSGVSCRCRFIFLWIFFFFWALTVEVDGVQVAEDVDGMTLAICVALTSLLLLGIRQQGVVCVSPPAAWSRSMMTWEKGLSAWAERYMYGQG